MGEKGLILAWSLIMHLSALGVIDGQAEQHSEWVRTEGCVQVMNWTQEFKLTNNCPTACYRACESAAASVALQNDSCRCNVTSWKAVLQRNPVVCTGDVLAHCGCVYTNSASGVSPDWSLYHVGILDDDNLPSELRASSPVNIGCVSVTLEPGKPPSFHLDKCSEQHQTLCYEQTSGECFAYMSLATWIERTCHSLVSIPIGDITRVNTCTETNLRGTFWMGLSLLQMNDPVYAQALPIGMHSSIGELKASFNFDIQSDIYTTMTIENSEYQTTVIRVTSTEVNIKIDEPMTTYSSQSIDSIETEIKYLSEMVPDMSETVPTMTETVPTMTDIVPYMSEMVPDLSEMVPDLSETVPNLSKMVPNMTEIMPNLTEVVSNIIEIVPNMSEIVPNMSEMVPNMTEIVPNMSEIVPNMTEMVSNMSEIVPDMSEMVPDLSEMVPGMSEMVPDLSEMGPGMSEMVPDLSEMVPGMSEMVPDWSEMVPGMSGMVRSVTSRNHHEASLISPTTSSHDVTERSDIFDSSQTFNRETAGSEIPKADALHGNTTSDIRQLVIAICVLTSLLVLVAIVGMVCLLRKLSEIHKDMITLSKSRRFNNTLTAAEDQANESVTNARTRRARYVRNLDDISPEGIQDGRNGDAYHFGHTRDQQLNEYAPQMDYFYSQNDPQHSRYSPEPWPQFSRTHRANTRSYGDHSQYMYSGGRDYNYGYRSNQANHNPLYNQGSHRTFSF